MDNLQKSTDDGAIGEEFQAKIRLAYHAGVVMLNRYKDIIFVLEDIFLRFNEQRRVDTLSSWWEAISSTSKSNSTV